VLDNLVFYQSLFVICCRKSLGSGVLSVSFMISWSYPKSIVVSKHAVMSYAAGRASVIGYHRDVLRGVQQPGVLRSMSDQL
jgi:hypothetical protein